MITMFSSRASCMDGKKDDSVLALQHAYFG